MIARGELRLLRSMSLTGKQPSGLMLISLPHPGVHGLENQREIRPMGRGLVAGDAFGLVVQCVRDGIVVG